MEWRGRTGGAVLRLRMVRREGDPVLFPTIPPIARAL
jgi:hypothetical protein